MVQSKTNRVLSFLMALAVLASLSCFFCTQRASAETDGEWQYSIMADGTAEITGYIGTSSSITVPAKVNNKVVSTVTALCTNNFKSRITAVTLSAGIRNISTSALSDYVNLERVSLPDTLTTIGTTAFYGCTSLAAVTVPASVSSIGDAAFANCTSLLSANLTCIATNIPSRLFDGCVSLSTVTLPAYIDSIGSDAFSGCRSLKSISIPDGVKTIGSSAFIGCTSLASAKLPYELKTIEEYAFSKCESLTSVFIPNKIKTIKTEAFSFCHSLREVYISPSISVINTGIFQGCEDIETVVFGGEYVTLSKVFDLAAHPTVYYPAKYSTSWKNYVDVATKSYTNTTSIKVSGSSTMTPGDKDKLKIVCNPSSGSFSDVYSIVSSDSSVATVATDGTVTAKQAGKTTITVTDVSGTTGTLTITVKPAKPTELTATPRSTSSVDLKWKSTGATGYYVYRSAKKNGTFKKIDTVLTNSYTDKGLTKGKTYYYKVVGYTNAGGSVVTSDKSKAVSIKVSAPAPSTVSAKKAKAGVATVTWGKSNGATGYEVYMATKKSGNYTKVATITNVSTLSYKKTGLTAKKTYYFKVRSYVTVNGTKVYSPFTKIVSVKV